MLYAQNMLKELVTVGASQHERWRYCVQLSQTLFGEIISNLYLTSWTPFDRQQKINEASFYSRLTL